MSIEEVNGSALSGKVKWFNKDKGYGFITMPDGSLDVFVHANQLRKSGIDRSLREGEQVQFATAKGDRGNYATNITLITESAAK